MGPRADDRISNTFIGIWQTCGEIGHISGNALPSRTYAGRCVSLPLGEGCASGSMLISTLKHLSLSSDRDQSSALHHKRWRLRASPQREWCHGELPYQHVVVEDPGQCQASLAPPGRDGRRRRAGISPASNRSPRAWSRVTGLASVGSVARFVETRETCPFGQPCCVFENGQIYCVRSIWLQR